MNCPIYRKVTRENVRIDLFSKYHLQLFEHGELPMCKNANKCQMFIRLKQNSWRNGDELIAAECHMLAFGHPAREGNGFK